MKGRYWIGRQRGLPTEGGHSFLWNRDALRDGLPDLVPRNYVVRTETEETVSPIGQDTLAGQIKHPLLIVAQLVGPSRKDCPEVECEGRLPSRGVEREGR